MSATDVVWSPTSVPGLAEDAQEAIVALEQFRAALEQKNEVVALLLLTPSAQRWVAEHDLWQFAPPSWRTKPLSNCRSTVTKDTAHVVCVWRTRPVSSDVDALLKRMNNRWKIDRIAVVDQP